MDMHFCICGIWKEKTTAPPQTKNGNDALSSRTSSCQASPNDYLSGSSRPKWEAYTKCSDREKWMKGATVASLGSESIHIRESKTRAGNGGTSHGARRSHHTGISIQAPFGRLGRRPVSTRTRRYPEQYVLRFSNTQVGSEPL